MVGDPQPVELEFLDGASDVGDSGAAIGRDERDAIPHGAPARRPS
jgi:hypothetical protein